MASRLNDGTMKRGARIRHAMRGNGLGVSVFRWLCAEAEIVRLVLAAISTAPRRRSKQYPGADEVDRATQPGARHADGEARGGQPGPARGNRPGSTRTGKRRRTVRPGTRTGKRGSAVRPGTRQTPERHADGEVRVGNPARHAANARTARGRGSTGRQSGPARGRGSAGRQSGPARGKRLSGGRVWKRVGG
ncbi:hypothetical protein GCM10010112_72520 [Actinoplanes lobatus]|nr:hypothetical protein GCM10010112_72520 [Actinoplanes lobatus]